MIEGKRSLSIKLLFLGDSRFDRRILSFAGFLRSAGHSVEILCGVTVSGEQSAGVHTILLSRSRGPLKFLEYHRKVTKSVLRGDPVDLVIACDLYSLGAAAIAKRKGRTLRAIYDSREVYTELPSLIGRPTVKRSWLRFEGKYLGAMDAILVTGTHDYEAIFAAHHFIPRGLLIRNLPALQPQNIDTSLRSRYRIPNDAALFVYLGGLQKGRGIAHFIKTLPSIDDTSRLLIIGEGDERASLETLAHDQIQSGRVIFAGAIESDEALSMLAACDVGISLIEPVSLSYEYALPSKLFEYMAAGLTTISSPLIHVRELFGEGEPWLFYANPAKPSEIVVAAVAALGAAKDPAVKHAARLRFETSLNATIELKKLTDLIETLFLE